MATRDLEPFHWKPGQSGNPAGRPRRGLDAVQRLESLGVDPLAEAIALARDASLPKVARLKAWLTLCEFAYPKLGPVSVEDKQTPALEGQAELLHLIKSKSESE